MFSGFTPVDIAVLAFSGFLVGLRRGGIQGPEILGVALMAAHLGASASVGIAVVIFLLADIPAVIMLFRDVDWRMLVRLLIPTVTGITVAAVVGRSIPEDAFEWILFSLILASFLTLLWQRTRHGMEVVEYTGSKVISLTAGFLAGFATMMGNMASVFLIIYFASVGARKEKFIATSACFFLFVNLMKLPVHIWIWKTLERWMLPPTLILIPVITLGVYLGRVIVRKLPEVVYWRFVFVVVAIVLLRYLLGLLGIMA